MRRFFLFIILNFTGILAFQNLSKKKYKSVISQTDFSNNSISTQTDLTINDMKTILKYKEEIDAIYNRNDLKYEWKFV